MARLRPLTKYHGGKCRMAKWIISHFPEGFESMAYLECCGGAANVLCAKEKSPKETYCDLDPAVVNMFVCLKERFPEFQARLKDISYDQGTFDAARESLIEEPDLGDLEAAINELVVRRMSRGGLKKSFAWSERLRGGIPGDVNAFRNFVADLHVLHRRIRDVNFLCQDAIELIYKRNRRNTLLYVDPPYLDTTRTAKNVYGKEMTRNQHTELAEALNEFKGHALISGYPSRLYNKLYSHWNRTVLDVPNNSGQGKTKQRRLEVLWQNY